MKQVKILSGFHSITTQIRLNSSSLYEIYIDEGSTDGRVQDLLKLIKQYEIKYHLTSKDRLDGFVKSGKHQGVIAKIHELKTKYVTIEDIVEQDREEPILLLVLDGIEDPHNLGACFRVADAMGVHAIICPKDNAVGLNDTVRKVASGGAESIPFIAVTNLARAIRYLKEMGIFVFGTDGKTDNTLYDVKFNGSIALIMGSEGKGMRRLTKDLCDQIFSIPMLGLVESLNVSVASGICLSEINRQKKS